MKTGRWRDVLRMRFRSLARRQRAETELDKELRYHIERQTEENITAGMNAREAREAASRMFGGVSQIEEECRGMRQTQYLENFLQDLHFGLRILLKNPSFTSVAVLALALGIGANTAMFSVIEAVLLRPLPYSNANELMRVASTYERGRVTLAASSSPPDFFDWRDENRSFSSMFAYYTGEYALTGHGEAKRVRVVVATAGLFSTLQAHPKLGREFRTEENRKGADHVVVLSYRLWEKEFGGAPALLGTTIELNNEPYFVIGVMPADFRFPPEGSDAYLPIGFDDKVMTQRGAHYLRVLGRLKRGVSPAQANDDLGGIQARLGALYPDTDKKWGLRADAWSRALVGEIRPALLVLLAAVGLVALIACANISNLLLTRATVRHREFAMRSALGAERSRLVRQMLTEGLLLASVAAAASLLLADWAVRAIVTFGPKDIPRLASARLNGRVLIFTLGVSAASAVLSALLPALRGSRMQISGLLKMSASSSREAGRARGALLMGEVALSMMLLAGAGLLVRSFVGLRSLSPGFDPKGVLTLDISLPDARYKNSAVLQSYWNDLLTKLRGLPGVTAVAGATPLPLSGDDFSSSFHVEGSSVPAKDEPSAELRFVTPDYFGAMAIPVLHGRAFTDTDQLGATRVLLISQTAARMFFPAGDALGQRIKFGARGGYEKNEGEIVGVVGDVRHFGVDGPNTPIFYLPLVQAGMDGATVVLRTQGLPGALGQAARRLVQGIDRDALVGEPVLLEGLLSDSLGQRRFYMMLLGAFAALALVLAAVGLYGVVSYAVAQRTHEIGIRVALGATRRQVLAMVMGQALRPAGLGLAIGLVLAMMLKSVLKGLLVGVSTTDPATFAVTALMLLTVAVFASYAPARRAVRVDPSVALRME